MSNVEEDPYMSEDNGDAQSEVSYATNISKLSFVVD